MLRAVRDTAAADAYLQQPPLADRVAEILADLGIDPERTAAAAANLIDVVERDLVDRVATHTTRQRRHSD